MKAAGYEGQYTNHSLKVSTATRLYSAGVDEQLIMDRTSHSSVTGVRTYKRKVEKLQEITSDVLNTANKVGKSAEHSVYDQTPVLCNKAATDQPISDTQKVSSGNLPSINVSGRSNITVNINLK